MDGLLDVPALMLSTYKALSGGEAAVSMEQLMKSEPVEDVVQLSASVMREVEFDTLFSLRCASYPGVNY